MNKSEQVFSYKTTTDYDEDVYEAKFQLPDDGCPNSEQFLRVRVLVDNGDQTAIIRLALLTSNGERVKELGAAESNFKHVAEMLYKSARLVTRLEIQPV